MKKYSLTALLLLVAFSPIFSLVAQAAEPDFGAINQFRDRWLGQDRLVGAAGVARPYTWGPNVPSAPVVLSELYQNSPQGQRRVLYLDKARMEINNPSNGYVTTGLAVKELVSGLRQDGDTAFSPRQPSQTQVAGDAVSVNPNAPVYASFRNLVTLGNVDSHSRPSAIGSTLNQQIAKDGSLSLIAPPENLMVGAYETQTGHNIAKAFQDFKNQRGPVTDPATGATINDQPIYTSDPTSNVFGLAISEPYWASTRVAGQNQTVLVQLFERRVLTYNPALSGSPLQKVEMGNLGQHYYQWRYVETNSNPTPTPSSTELDSEEKILVAKLNQYRQDKGLARLTLNQNIVNAAKWLSQDMATRNYLNHTDSLNRDPFTRVAAFGYAFLRGENIGAGVETGSEMFEAWKASPDHNANLLDSSYTTLGVGRAYNAGSTSKWYWTLDLGGQ